MRDHTPSDTTPLTPDELVPDPFLRDMVRETPARQAARALGEVSVEDQRFWSMYGPDIIAELLALRLLSRGGLLSGACAEVVSLNQERRARRTHLRPVFGFTDGPQGAA
ncbi:hypothetical protein FHY55_19360 [Oceanicola sp. D3]|uniref:hypothetical protein n=1 Tax=Oceanicola sp. D3 TaxID=2587163 RepID=UPI00111D822A|nr:hypothetical protein [Oceanicola sp. D3]QDC11257.1 hypothetical protein FHY55_19360 [Oceanicola sp. D3]